MAFAEKVVRSANQVRLEDIDALRGHGYSDEQILDIALTAASRSFFSKVTDAIGFRPPEAFLKQAEVLMGTEAFRTMMVGRTFGTEGGGAQRR